MAANRASKMSCHHCVTINSFVCAVFFRKYTFIPYTRTRNPYLQTPPIHYCAVEKLFLTDPMASVYSELLVFFKTASII
jgi:hypothetical protein